MQTFLYILAIIMFWHPSSAQNLVPNPGFEDVHNCIGTIDNPLSNPRPSPLSLKNWFTPTLGTPDYYNECELSASFSDLGLPTPHGGKAYVGVYAHLGDKDRPNPYIELLETELTEPLKADSFYNVSCYVRLLNRNKVAVITAFKSIAASLSDTQLLSTARMIVPYTDLHADDNRYLEANDWIKVSGIYKALGNERWLTLGGYFSKDVPHSKTLFPEDSAHIKYVTIYYVIDDVSITKRQGCETFYTSLDTILCNSGEIPATLSSTAPNGAKYIWSTGDTAQSISISKGGTYLCSALIGCNTYIDSYFVKTEIDTSLIVYPTIPYCETKEFVMTASAIGKSYLWSNGYTEKEISTTNPGIYTCYTVVDDCAVTAEQFTVKPYPTPANFTNFLSDTVLCSETDFKLGINHQFKVSYSWNTNDTTCCIIPTQSGKYIVTITTEKCGSVLDSAYITIKDCDNCLFIPSAFTPNQDNTNDIFRAIPSCPINKFSLHLYNRWGQEVFTTQNISNGWNGMQGPDNADVGTYFYYIEYKLEYSSQNRLLKGEVMLIR